MPLSIDQVFKRGAKAVWIYKSDSDFHAVVVYRNRFGLDVTSMAAGATAQYALSGAVAATPLAERGAAE